VGNIGPEKLMLLFLVALIVLGPARLPEAARTVGKVVGELRRLSGDFRSEVRDALFDPVAGTRDALRPSAWDGSVTAPPLGVPAEPAEAPGYLDGDHGGPTAYLAGDHGDYGDPGGRGEAAARPGSTAAMPLPDDPSLN
jgi:sec-independent protein translocase protein TatB